MRHRDGKLSTLQQKISKQSLEIEALAQEKESLTQKLQDLENENKSLQSFLNTMKVITCACVLLLLILINY